MMTKRELARMMDVTLVRNNHTFHEVDQLIEAAREHHFACVFIMQCYAEYVRDRLKDVPDVHVGGVMGFPSGAEYTAIKLAETEKNMELGLHEMDMVINISMLLSDKFDYVRDEVRQIKEKMGADIPLKCILEMSVLDEYHAKKACELCMEAGADYVKTGTGWFGPATHEQVRLMRSVVGDHMYIKAAGGIRTLAEVERFRAEGVHRVGVGLPSALSILEEAEE